MSVVQQHGFDGGVATSKAVIITSSTAGTSIIVGSCGNGAASGVPTDNIGNTWPAAALGPISATQNLTVWVLPGNLNTGGITTVTIHQPAPCGWVVEEDGLIASPVDKVAGQTFTGTAVTSGNTATLSQAAEVCYGFASNQNNITYTAGSLWSAAAFTSQGGTGTTVVGNQENTTVGPNILFIERQVVSATTALAATMSQVGGGFNEAGIVTLMQGSGPIAPPAPMYYRKNVLYFI